MNAYGATPAARSTGPFTPDRRDWLRLIGGIMFAAGALVLLARKGNEWSEWAVLAGLLVPSLLLFALALAGGARHGLQGWQAAFLVFATLLLLASLLQLVVALDGNPRASLNLLWTFGVTGVVALATSFALRAPYQMLLGATALIVTWLALWDKVLDNPSGGTVRWLLVALAAIYLVGGLLLQRARRLQASDLIAVGGAVAVLAGALSFASGTTSVALGQAAPDTPNPAQGWNVFLLVVSLLLIAYGSRSATRGPAYVGVIGLVAFIVLTGADLVSRLSGDDVGGVVGWPLILLVGGVLLLLLSFLLKPGALGGPRGTTSAPDDGPRPGAQLGREGGYGEPAAAAPGYEQPGPVAPPQAQPGAAAPPQPGAVPPGQQPPEPGKPGSLLDQWRHQPPPGGPPQQ